VKPLTHLHRTLAAIPRAWFSLTRDEQRATAVVLTLLLLGALVRFWHICLAG